MSNDDIEFIDFTCSMCKTVHEADSECPVDRVVSKRNLAQEALRKAETAWHEYARECDVGEERTKAFEVFESVRNAQRVY